MVMANRTRDIPREGFGGHIEGFGGHIEGFGGHITGTETI